MKLTSSVLKPILGIDVSKDDFHVLLRTDSDQFMERFSNSACGFKALVVWIKRHHVLLNSVHATLEATGPYSFKLASFLHPLVGTLSLVNPLRTHAFGKSQLRRCKTDPADCRLIADFTQTQNPPAWIPPSKVHCQLKALVRHIDDLQSQLGSLKTKLSMQEDKAVLCSMKALIRFYELQIKKLNDKLQDLIESDQKLSTNYKLLISIPGIGHKTASFLLGELPDMAQFESARHLACFAGVTPAHKQSGKSASKTPMSKKGSPYLRKALYFPAIVASRHNAKAKAFAERLTEKGKPPLCIIGAIMHKLLHWIYGVLKHQKPFDACYGSSPLAPPARV